MNLKLCCHRHPSTEPLRGCLRAKDAATSPVDSGHWLYWSVGLDVSIEDNKLDKISGFSN